MPGLTIKGMPDEVYRRLKDRAERNRRSLNAEVIVALEEATGLRAASHEDVLERIRTWRGMIASVDHELTNAFKEEGRL